MLAILSLVVIIVATIHVYKTAKSSGRNAAVWALFTFLGGFGIQLVIPFFIGFIIGLVMLGNGSSPAQIQEAVSAPATIFGIVCLILSIVFVFLILKYLSKIPEEKPFTPPPEPPENFG